MKLTKHDIKYKKRTVYVSEKPCPKKYKKEMTHKIVREINQAFNDFDEIDNSIIYNSRNIIYINDYISKAFNKLI